MNPLISVIIPNFNREYLLEETLISLENQTYKNWECLLIDDCSTDNSEQIIKQYAQKDKRFNLYMRPTQKPKGANACRNYGLELAKGEYVVFFDSDDLMTPNHLEIKCRAIIENDCDFVITQTRYFNSDDLNKILVSQYNFKNKDISLYNFISHKVVWLTCDVCIKKVLAKSISFNEKLQSGQEYNYFSKLLQKNLNCIYINDVITLRRHHDNSIRGSLRKDSVKTSMGLFMTYWYTFQDLKDKAPKPVLQFLLYRCFRLSIKMPKTIRPFKSEVLKELIRYFSLKGVYYNIQLMLKY